MCRSFKRTLLFSSRLPSVWRHNFETEKLAKSLLKCQSDSGLLCASVRTVLVSCANVLCAGVRVCARPRVIREKKVTENLRNRETARLRVEAADAFVHEQSWNQSQFQKQTKSIGKNCADESQPLFSVRVVAVFLFIFFSGWSPARSVVALSVLFVLRREPAGKTFHSRVASSRSDQQRNGGSVEGVSRLRPARCGAQRFILLRWFSF